MSPVWLVLGTLTILPVPAPRSVDRRSAGWAMTLAPLVGLLLAVVPTAFLVLDGDPLLVAVLAVGVLAVLTRGLHLDGLADTADGLGSGRRADQALAIMKRSDIGPFGVATLVLAILVQVSAIAALDDPWAVGAAIVVSRAVLPLVCVRWFSAARPEGLGATVAGSVAWWQAAIALGVAGLVCWVAGAPYSLIGLLAGLALAWHCRRRFGGMTGDVYGACVEITLAAALLAELCLRAL
ncbi:Cobalamin (vitamin B12) biosynthesis CobS, cobalamin-5-phosphate synthase [metagenome]|uniref:Adenosylcobinamide-GDP ribazoletransferase n=1 Tax=metagenome TaxID=256318 RepID=A0A2P2C4P7_9ZZZZ